MKKNTPYTPDDIENLLLTKSFVELTETEQEFALTQVDSAQEYGEMRSTLLAVTQLAKEESAVEVSPEIKAALMAQMEEKANRVPWYTWTGISALLFPTNTPLFKKPGLQLATFALLLLIVINLGINQLQPAKGQLAINSTKTETSNKRADKQIEKSVESSVETEKEEVAIPTPVPAEISEPPIDNKETVLAPNIELMDEMEEEIALSDDEIVVDQNVDNDVEMIQPTKDVSAPQRVESQTLSNGSDLAVTPTLSRSNATIQLSEIESEDYKKKVSSKKNKPMGNSQSLANQSAAIDLLFVAL